MIKKEMKNILPNNWIRLSLGDVSNSQKGKLPKEFSTCLKDGFLPYIDIKAFEKNEIRRYAKIEKSVISTSKDILVVWDGARFGLSGFGCEGVLGSTLVRINSDYLETKFLYYFIHNNYKIINSKPRGTGTPHVDPETFWSLSVNIAPLNEQKRIVDKIEQLFSDLDKGEDLIKTIQKQLKTYLQSALKSAVTGELTKDWREKNQSNVESGKSLIERISSDIIINKKDLKNFNEDDLPSIPKSWTWATLPQLGEFGRGKSKHIPRNDPALYENGKYPFLQTGVIRKSSERVSRYDKLYNEMGLKQSKLWPKVTVCITIAANIAESAILDIQACFPDSIVGLVPHKEVSGEFIEFFIRTAKGNLDRFAPATAQKNINLEILKAVAIPIPPYQEQLAIYEKANKILSNILSIEKWCIDALKESKSLRQSILKSAFSGKLVTQDPNDEPASKLLERIKSTKQELENNQLMKKKK